MNKKIIILATLIGLLTFLIATLLMVFNRTPPELPPPAPISVTPISESGVSAKKITISGIKTNNFLANPIKTNSRGDAVFIKTPEYQIVYLKNYEEFVINLSTSSAETRDSAENDFLSKLGVTKEEACRLRVTVSAPYVSTQTVSMPQKSLSFCSKKQQEY